MNHVAFDVPPEKIDEYRERPARAGIDVTPVVNHDESPNQASKEITPSTFVRSLYFRDPDGIMLEFAAWTRELDERDVNCDPATAADCSHSRCPGEDRALHGPRPVAGGAHARRPQPGPYPPG
jgi:hypothetical protein